MKARIYVNRHIMAANKKATKNTGQLVDRPAIAVNTYEGSIYCKEVGFTQGCKLIQDAANARCGGATIWIEADDFESLVIDGIKASRSMYEEPEPLELEDYFWQFVEDFKAIKDENYIAIARRLSPKYAANKKALQVMFKELQKKLELSIDDFDGGSSRSLAPLEQVSIDDLTSSLVGLGKERYYSVLKNPRSATRLRSKSFRAMYLTDSTKSYYSVLNLLNS